MDLFPPRVHVIDRRLDRGHRFRERLRSIAPRCNEPGRSLSRLTGILGVAVSSIGRGSRTPGVMVAPVAHRQVIRPRWTAPKSQWDDWRTPFFQGDVRLHRPRDMRCRPVPRAGIVYEYGNWIARWKCQLQRRVKRIAEGATDIFHWGSLAKLIRVDGGHQPAVDPTRNGARSHPWCAGSNLFTTSVQRKCETAIRLAVVYTWKQGAIASRHRFLTLGVPGFEHADGRYANTGTVHKGKPQYRPTQTQAVQVLQSSFCSSWLRPLEVGRMVGVPRQTA